MYSVRIKATSSDTESSNQQVGSDRDTSICLYDITTYAFESTDQDALRDFGYSKDKKFNEVQVVMGLATDKQGLPSTMVSTEAIRLRGYYGALC